MCRPTKRPKPLAALAAATATPMMPPMPMYETAEMIEPMDFAKEFETFVFDLKEDPNSFVTKSTTTEEVVAMGEAQPVVTMETIDVKLGPLPTVVEDDRPKTFVYAAFEMVSDTKNAAAIGFNEDGTMIEIRDLELLSEKILPSYFRHKNVTSFYRQLNSYGFRTTRSSTPGVVHAFSHEMFRVGREDLLANIFRKKCLKKEARLAAKKEMDSKQNGANPPSPVSISSSGSSEDVLMLETVGKPVSCELESSKAAVVRMQEEAQALEAANRRLQEETNNIYQEGSKLISSANQNAEVYRSLVGLLFGAEASTAFAEQSRPFLMDRQRFMASSSPSMSMPSPVVVPVSGDIQEMGCNNNNIAAESLFEDDDLALLESIFA